MASNAGTEQQQQGTVPSNAVSQKRKRGVESNTDEVVSTPSGNISAKGEQRTDYINWEEYFMSIAFLSSQRSKDPVTQVGACIVNKDNRIVGVGYNGMPNGCHDRDMPWGKPGGKHGSNRVNHKSLYVCHAEMNAIMNKNSADLRGCTMFVSLYPCNECAKLIIQSGIKKVVYYSDPKPHKPEFEASKRLLNTAKISNVQ